ncbi:MAG: dihydrodipicolinate synthase family protein [Treponema sp.]|nr:dihydrodipicolinate synthase family protein [Treponema sp.]
MLNKGFYCALGTPLDDEGNLVTRSLAAHIESQIDAGASGLLLMGTMGMLGCVRDCQYGVVVKTAAEAVRGRVPLMVGAADNSIARIRDRLDVLKNYEVMAVLTPPYYFSQTRQTALNCLSAAANVAKIPVYLYDHPFTAKYKLNYDDVLELSRLSNIKGIKTGDPVLIKSLLDSTEIKKDFTPIFSNSDLFVMGWSYGVRHILDGIFGCFPQTIKAAGQALAAGDLENAKFHLNLMMGSRDRMIGAGIWPMFSKAMNLLGFPGNFAPDYEPDLSSENSKLMEKILTETGEI